MTEETKEQDQDAVSDVMVRTLVRELVGELAPASTSQPARPEQVLRDELGYDSVRQVELTFILEELFGFESQVIEEAPFMDTVGDLEEFTLKMISQGNAKSPSPSDVARVKELVGAQSK
ncbi:hypothetical protein ACFXKC_42310 [Streptomyces sp. NPDC059340]|uniref:hypothetical protein n=1 Tax=Streptomyces sp. NPDC059340 TaxID=3346806 RepID=UPI0036C68B81